MLKHWILSLIVKNKTKVFTLNTLNQNNTGRSSECNKERTEKDIHIGKKEIKLLYMPII